MSTGGTDHDPLAPTGPRSSHAAEKTQSAGQVALGMERAGPKVEGQASVRLTQQGLPEDGKLKKKKKLVVLKTAARGSLAPVAQVESPEGDLEAYVGEELLGLLSSLEERQKKIETKLEGWMDKQCDGMQRQDKLLGELLGHLASKSMVSFEERRQIADTRKRFGFEGKDKKPALSRAASDGAVMSTDTIRPPRQKDREQHIRNWEERERAKLLVPPATSRGPAAGAGEERSVSFSSVQEQRSVSFVPRETVDLETNVEGKASLFTAKSVKSGPRASAGNLSKVAQIKTIRCSVEREEAFSQLRKNQMGERYGTKGTFGSREKFVANVTSAVRSQWLEWCTLTVTVLSAVLVGWEVDRAAESSADLPAVLVVFKHLTTLLFLMEVSARILVDGKEFFDPYGDDIGWHVLEIIMVTAGIAEFIVDCAGFSGQASFLVVIRIGRAARLLRIHRVLQKVPALRMIYHSMLATTRSLFWAIAMLSIVIYCFAIVFQQVATRV
ncbi:unnamed protein product [Symbiodinium natans]|uniref:Ion transport domain-containing protein n=1 Tax=Symbiodinium natans TaxID=878477 RepID=A0A812KT40_9DINO|nr:unnamed protein product [Symbiodinium natans]